MITATVDMTNFNAGIDALRRSVGVSSRKLVEKETGELIKTLVKQAPAANAAKIKDDIKRRFETIGMELSAPLVGKTSQSGLKWVGVNRNYLTGVAPDKDMRGASVDELKRFIYTVTKKGRIRKDFKHPRKVQRVLLLQRIISKPSTVAKLAMAKSKNRGRLRASWLKSVIRGVITLTGGNMPPEWVNRHARGAMGDYNNGLDTKDNPNFTIKSAAKGVKKEASSKAIARAVRDRAIKMVENAKLFASGKKNLSDYK